MKELNGEIVLTELLEIALKKRDMILKEVRHVKTQVEKVKEFWVSYSPSQDITFTTICGIDGSMNYREFKGFALYAVSAEGVVFNNSLIHEERMCDIDVLYPYYKVSERVRLYMSTLEIMIALKTLDKVNLLLLDGSILSNILRQAPNPTPKVLEVVEKYFDITSNETLYDIKLIKYSFENELNSDYEIAEALYTLEYIRFLTLLTKLIQNAKSKIVAIAKNSQSTLYFKDVKPDILIFEKLTKEVGYSKPLVRRLSDMIPYYKKLIRRKFIHIFANIDFTIFYARLHRNGPVLKFEIPCKLSNLELKKILDIVSFYSVDGYPYPLRKAHEDTDIKDKEFENLIRLFKLYEEKTGREQLGLLMRW